MNKFSNTENFNNQDEEIEEDIQIEGKDKDNESDDEKDGFMESISKTYISLK
jgi:hypothetical protein